MKKILTILLILSIYSCTTEEGTNTDFSPSSEQFEIINYTFNGTTYKLKYSKDRNNELVPVEDQSMKTVQRIVDNNETLIFHYLDDNNIILFEKDEDLMKYLRESGRPLSKTSGLTAGSGPYQCGNLLMFVDSYFNGGYFSWDTDANGYVRRGVSCLGTQYLYFNAGSEIDRLKHFGTTSNWSTYCTSFPSCGGATTSTNPNDKVSSIQVCNVFARFYEHANYGGKSITRDARGGGCSNFDRLKSVGYGAFGNWDNRISSVTLSF